MMAPTRLAVCLFLLLGFLSEGTVLGSSKEALKVQSGSSPVVRAGLEERLLSPVTLAEAMAGRRPSVLSPVPADLLRAPAILVVLAGGEGKRMGSVLPKPALKVHGKPTIRSIQDAARSLGIPVVAVVGEKVKPLRQALAPGAVLLQCPLSKPRPMGTAVGLAATEEILRGYPGTVLVAMGDMPWLEPETLEKLLKTHRDSQAQATYLTASVTDPSGLARILRFSNGSFFGEIQVADLNSLVQSGTDLLLSDGTRLTPSQLEEIREVGTGTYAFDGRILFDALRLVRNDNPKKEFYLPSVLPILREKGHQVSTVSIQEETVMSVDTPEALQRQETLLAQRSLQRPVESWGMGDWIAALDRAQRLLEEPAIRRGWVEEGRPLADFLKGSPSFDTPWHRLGLGVLAELVSIFGPSPSVVEEEVQRYLRVVNRFEEIYGPGPALLLRAPGRGILMGGHNDYNWGAELLVTLPVDTLAVVRGRADTLVRLASTDPDPRFSPRKFDLDRELPPTLRGDWNRILEKVGVPPFDWANYVKGSVLYWQNRYAEESLRGMDILVDSTLPMERGISSSSALVVIAGMATHLVNGKPVNPQEMAQLCCFAEWYVGTRGGGLDHAISILGQRGHALKLLPDSQDVVSISLPVGYHFVMADSLVPADKTGSVRNAFNQRSAETRLLGLALFRVRFPTYAGRIRYLRDVTAENLGVAESEIDAMVEQLPEAISTAELAQKVPAAVEQLSRSYPGLPEPSGGWRIRQRVRHIVRELRRVERATEALRKADMTTFGRLMDEAFASYRDDYEITVPDLEELVGLARAVPGVLGANLQGGGFGGFAMVLVADQARERLVEVLQDRYYTPRGLDRSVVLGKALFLATPSRGAGRVVPQAAASPVGLEERIWPETTPLTFKAIEPILTFQAEGGFGDAAYLVKLIDGFNARGITPIVAVVGPAQRQADAMAKLEQLEKDIPVTYRLWREQNGQLVESDGRPVAGNRDLRPVLIQHFSLVNPDWPKETADRLVPRLFQPLYQGQQQKRFFLIGYSEPGNLFGGYLTPDQGEYLNLYPTLPIDSGPHQPNPIYTGYLFDRQLRTIIEEIRATPPEAYRPAVLERLSFPKQLSEAALAKKRWIVFYTSQGGSRNQLAALIQALPAVKGGAVVFTFFERNRPLWYYPDHYWKPHDESVRSLKENAGVSFVDLAGLFESRVRDGAPILVVNLKGFPLGTYRRLLGASNLMTAPGLNSWMEGVAMATDGLGPRVVLPFPLFRLQRQLYEKILRSVGATETLEEIAAFHRLRDLDPVQAEYQDAVRKFAGLLQEEEAQNRFQRDIARLAALFMQRSGNPSDGNLANRLLELLVQLDQGVPDSEMIPGRRQPQAEIEQYQARVIETFRRGEEPTLPMPAGLEEALGRYRGSLASARSA